MTDGARVALGSNLRELGLDQRAVRHVFGTLTAAHAADSAGSDDRTPPPAAMLVWLFVGGHSIDAAAFARYAGDDTLSQMSELCELRDGRVWPRVLLLPIGDGLVACDCCRRNEPSPDDAVAIPDDSAFHLLGSLPADRVESWLDVGTGNGIAPLARPGLADRIAGTDIHERAIDFAELGKSFEARAGAIDFRRGDLLAPVAGERFDLVTFNAPIPGDDTGTPYVYGDADVLVRFWSEVPAAIADGGEVIVHSVAGAAPDLSGELVEARYTPPGVSPAFAVTRWRPAGPHERRQVSVELSDRQPHVARRNLAPS